jgi:hypothetical protein
LLAEGSLGNADRVATFADFSRHVKHSGRQPSIGNVIRMLKDGYWDRTEVIELPGGERRVRKRTKGAGFGPWGIGSLRREINFLGSLPERASAVFPPVLAAWDDESGAHPDVGYEMPFYADHLDAGELARGESLAQDEIDEFQDVLAAAVSDRLHEPVAAKESLAGHVASVVEHAWQALEKDPALARLIHAPSILLNGEPVLGPRAAFERIRSETGVLSALDAGPCVRLHGDLFLENILWRPAAVVPTVGAPRLLLIDPVSVAGVVCGPPVFDLVKYVSYATGELLALRSERVEIGEHDGAGGPGYVFRIRWEDPALQPFRTRNWHARFLRAFETRYGPVDRGLYELIDGYFSAAMAVNTGGKQRRARLLKATAAFNAVLK